MRTLMLFFAMNAVVFAADPVVTGGFTVRLREAVAAEPIKPLAAALFENVPNIKAEFEKSMGLPFEATARLTFLQLQAEGNPSYQNRITVFALTPTGAPDAAAVFKATDATDLQTTGLKLGLMKYGNIVAVGEKQVFVVQMEIARAPGTPPGVPRERPKSLPEESGARLVAAIAKATAYDAEQSATMAKGNELLAGMLDVQQAIKGNRNFDDKEVPATFLPLKAATTGRSALWLEGKKLHLTVAAAFPDAAKATEGGTAAKKAIALGNAYLEIAKYDRDVTAVSSMVQILDAITTATTAATVTQQDKIVIAKASLELDDTLLPTLLNAISKTREAAARSTMTNNFKQIGLAMHSHNDTFNMLPENIYAADKKTPLLSWRVQILPFIEQENLYRQFKPDEPWDSEHNKKLIERMPRIYSHPSAKTDVVGGTFVQGFVCDPKAQFRSMLLKGELQKLSIQGIMDGSSNTILVAEAETAVPWTKPDDIAFDSKGARPKVGKHWAGGGFLALFGDGSVRLVPGKTTDEMLKRLIQHSDGQVVTFD